MAAGKLGIQQLITHTQSLGEFDIDTDGKIKFSTLNAGPTFTIEVKGRIAGQNVFTFIDNVVGPAEKTVNVLNWDFLQINITVYDSTTNYVQVNASGTNVDTAAMGSISTPLGTTLVAVSDLAFISSDNSVSITGNTGNNTIDLKAAGLGKYIKNITLPDWILALGEYTITIPASTHGVLNPTATCYELITGSYNELWIATNIDTSNNIIITASQTPDTRFIGKVVVE